MDLSTLKLVIWIITRLVNTGNVIDLWGFFREFRRTVYEEIDFVTEAANAKRFYEIFKDDPTIYIPRIHEDYVTRRALVMEWIDGVKINDYAAIDAAGIDRLEIAKRTINAYFHQFFDIGFFHADPHPGNILVKRNSTPENPIVAFLDFGMVGSITKQMKRSFNEAFLGVITRDAHKIVNAVTTLGFIGEGANVIAIERAISLLLDQYYGATLGQVRDLDMRDVAQDIIGLLYGQPFRIPAQFAFSGRAIGTLVGVTTGLAPDFNFVEVALPYARNFLGLGKDTIADTAKQALTQLLDVARVAAKLPRSIEQLITSIEAGQIEIRLANLPLSNRPRRPGRGGRVIPLGGGNFSLALAFIGSLIGGAYLTSAHIAGPGWFCLGLAGIIALGLLLRR